MKPASIPAADAQCADPAAPAAQPATESRHDSSNGSPRDRMEVVARLPLLGPLIGWTRSVGPDMMRSRIWACLDGYESEPPLAMMTVGWNRVQGAIHPGSARLWRLNAIRLARDDPERRLHIGLADVLLPIGAVDHEVRVVALHRCIRGPGGESAPSLPFELPPEERAAEGWRPPLALGRQLLALIESGWRSQAPLSAGRARPVADGEAWPQPQSIDVAALLPQPRSRHAVRAWLHEFAREALQAVDHAQDAAAAFERRRLVAAAPLLRKSRHHLPPAQRAVVPGPGVRASMKSSRRSTPAPRTTLCFAAGCCRYPGTPFERDRADAALQALAARADSEDGPAFAIFSGDQVYADATAGVFETQGRRERVAARYESAFSTPAFAELARRLPLYMTADDHEITDGWSMPATHALHLSEAEIFRNDRLAHWASQLFLGYQRMHGPPPQAGAAKWYPFEVAGVRFFMMDTRFERGFARDGGAPPLCSDAQLAALGDWLEAVEREQPGAPKFIVSGSVYAPGLAEWDGSPAERVRADNWQGFAAERAAIARRVAQARVDNVVFLSGDYHCAAVAAIGWLDGGAGTPLDLRAWSIVSPPLYAPFPFANSRAENVLPHEPIRRPGAAATDPPLAHCDARAFDRSGFALIRVTHGGGLPIELEVEFLDPSARDPDQVSRLERLSGWRVTRPLVSPR